MEEIAGTEVHNTLSKLTQKAIKEAFLELLEQKSLDKITVKDIIELADVNRNTFYYHYEDINDLLECVFEDEEERFIAELGQERTFYDQYLKAAEIFATHKEAIIHISRSKRRDILQEYLETILKILIRTHIEKVSIDTELPEKGIDFITQFYTYGIVGATLHWVEEGMPEYREKLMRTIYEALDATVEPMIRSYIDGHPDECGKTE